MELRRSVWARLLLIAAAAMLAGHSLAAEVLDKAEDIA